MIVPTPGRVVAYTLTEHDAEQINRRRRHARASDAASGQTGVIIHSGNTAAAGEVYPMVIVRCWGTTKESAVNAQVLLDGNDTFWATSRVQGEGPGQWHEFPRV